MSEACLLLKWEDLCITRITIGEKKYEEKEGGIILVQGVAKTQWNVRIELFIERISEDFNQLPKPLEHLLKELKNLPESNFLHTRETF